MLQIISSQFQLIILLLVTQWCFIDGQTTYIDYRGCYVEMPNRYNFFWWPRDWDRNNKVSCIDKCFGQDFYFAAINNRDDCYCGNGYLDTYGMSQNCYNATINRVPSTVGTKMSSAVYATGKRQTGRQSTTPSIDERYMGCWRGKTDIFGSHFVVIAKGDLSMTVDKCINQCNAENHIFTALGLGTNCYCGNTLQYGGQVQPTDGATCQAPCSGAVRDRCGSRENEDIIALYRSIPKICRDGYYGRLCRKKCQCAGYPCNRDTGRCLKKCTPGSKLPQCRTGRERFRFHFPSFKDDGQYLCHSCIWSNISFVEGSEISFLKRSFPNHSDHESSCGDPFPTFRYNGSSCSNASFCVKFNFTLNNVHYLVRDCLEVEGFSCTPFQIQLGSIALTAGIPSFDFSCCRGDLCNLATNLQIAVSALLSSLILILCNNIRLF